MKNYVVCPILLAIFSTACVKRPQLTEAATKVRLLMKTEPVTGCEELGDVSTGNDWLRSVADVKKYLRNRVAEIGGNLAVVDVLEKEDDLYKGSGRGFRCQKTDGK